MHELVVVSGIVEAVSRYARQEGKRVVRFRVAVGELAGFSIELIRELLRDMVKKTELEGAEFSVEAEAAGVKCLSCGATLGFRELIGPLSEDEREMMHFLPELVSSFSRCPRCGGRDFEIESGRSVKIVEVELE